MTFKQVLGQEHIKKHLLYTANSGRIPHAQLFLGPEGSGTLPMALAYAQHLICNQKGESLGDDHATCLSKCASYMHPDLHFVFPVATSTKIRSNACSDDYIDSWRKFVAEQPYGNLFDWYRLIGVEKKQGQIGVEEAKNISKKLSLTSYEGGRKVMILWMAEKMHSAAANKLLKIIEEPAPNTVLILVSENEELLMNTIKSRCQLLRFLPLQEKVISDQLVLAGIEEAKAKQYAHESNGNYNKASDLSQNSSEDLDFEKWFVSWVRTAFRAKGNRGAIHKLITWSDDLAQTGRESQKNFISYCISLIRQAMLLNFSAQQLVYTKIHVDNFDLAKFARFIHENNIELLFEELEKAYYHIERNGNAKLIFTDLSIKLTRLLHYAPNKNT